MRKIAPLFLALLLFARDYDPALVRKAEGKIQKIKRESHRSLRWLFSKKTAFSEREVNSYVNYSLEKREGDVIFRGARIKLEDGYVLLGGALILKKPAPGFEITSQGARIILLSLKFRILQKKGKYRISLQEAFLGRKKAPIGLFRKLLPMLKQATGFNFDEERWERFPWGIRKIKLRKGKVVVYY